MSVLLGGQLYNPLLIKREPDMLNTSSYEDRIRKLAVCLLLSVSSLLSCADVWANDDGPLNSWVDHLIWGTGDLQQAVVEFEKKAGRAPAFGGKHPHLGTANYLASLGDKVYLEILGPDTGSEPGVLANKLAELPANQLLGFVLSTANLDKVAEAARISGLQVYGPIESSRQTETGDLLTWQGLALMGHGYGDYVPFFIDWGDTPHPADTRRWLLQ